MCVSALWILTGTNKKEVGEEKNKIITRIQPDQQIIFNGVFFLDFAKICN